MSCLRRSLIVATSGKEEGGRRHEAGGGRQPGGHAARGARCRAGGPERQVVDLWLVGQQKEGVEPLQPVGGAGAPARAVEVGILDTLAVKLIDAPGRALLQGVHLTELDRVGGAGLGAGGLLSRAQTIIAEGALVGLAVVAADV